MSRVVHHRYRLIFSICYRTKAFARGSLANSAVNLIMQILLRL